MTRQQTYDMRVTLTPNAAGDITPVVFRMGVREIVPEIVDGLVTFGETTWAVDPITMRSEVPTIEVELLRDGRPDFRSLAEDLFATYHIGELILRVWIGHPDLAREHWGHVDDFIIDDYEAAGASIKLYCVSPLALALRDIPEFSGSTKSNLSITHRRSRLCTPTCLRRRASHRATRARPLRMRSRRSVKTYGRHEKASRRTPRRVPGQGAL